MAVVRPMVAVVKQADVPVRVHEVEKFGQGARALGEDEAQHPFVGGQGAGAANHVAHMAFGQFVVRQINGGEAVFVKFFGDAAVVAGAVRGQANEHMGLLVAAHAVVELCDVARCAAQGIDQADQAAEAAALFGNGDSKQPLAFFAHFGAFGYKAQTVKIHVGAAQNGGKGLALAFVGGHVLLDGRHSQSACGLHNAAGVDEHVFDGGANRVGIDFDEVIYQGLVDAQGFFAHLLDGGAV